MDEKIELVVAHRAQLTPASAPTEGHSQHNSGSNHDPQTLPESNSSDWVRYSLAAIALVYAFFAGLKTVADFDLGWQLATGRYILQHLVIPSADVFSYTAHGNPWMYPPFSGMIFYLLFLVGGYTALSSYHRISNDPPRRALHDSSFRCLYGSPLASPRGATFSPLASACSYPCLGQSAHWICGRPRSDKRLRFRRTLRFAISRPPGSHCCQVAPGMPMAG